VTKFVPHKPPEISFIPTRYVLIDRDKVFPDVATTRHSPRLIPFRHLDDPDAGPRHLSVQDLMGIINQLDYALSEFHLFRSHPDNCFTFTSLAGTLHKVSLLLDSYI
jgi:hypothetical protein